MAKNLVIVESPAKVKTVKKYLGSSYDVVASKDESVEVAVSLFSKSLSTVSSPVLSSLFSLSVS